jgi:hypothetical protein
MSKQENTTCIAELPNCRAIIDPLFYGWLTDDKD